MKSQHSFLKINYKTYIILLKSCKFSSLPISIWWYLVWQKITAAINTIYDNCQSVSTTDDIGNYLPKNYNKYNPTNYLPVWAYISQLYKAKDCVVIKPRTENELLMETFCNYRLVNCNNNTTAPVDISKFDS